MGHLKDYYFIKLMIGMFYDKIFKETSLQYLSFLSFCAMKTE